MKLQINNPKQALNKAYLKEKVSRTDINKLKAGLFTLRSKLNEDESEEHLKNLVNDFLVEVWYGSQYEINTKDRKDLVIHTGKTAKSPVGVLIEVKKPSNTQEMLSEKKINTKALHELILYYLRERFDESNAQLKHLIITNIYEWYIFDEYWFEKNIFRSTRLGKDYNSWKDSGKDTRFFYDSILSPFLESLDETANCTYFDIRRSFSLLVEADDPQDDLLIPLFKILSPTHLLQLAFVNDNNTLNRKFYVELLHLMGLEEKDKLIGRKKKSEPASLLENIIIKIEDKHRIEHITNIGQYGESRKEQLFQVALELTITWINRILFLKLLEAQLLKYHRDNPEYQFLNYTQIFDFGELNNLFFSVLAEPEETRRAHIKTKYKKIPYLNSSLFEPTKLESEVFDISALDNRLNLPIHTSSVLLIDKTVKKQQSLPILEYLFRFLDSYDFTSEGFEAIQEQDKNLINASVLGLIFEKINGYKDGSIYTPGSITMYISKQTIRNSVIKKFNTQYSLDCTSFDDLKNFITPHYKKADLLDFNRCVNSLRICDPAVGSGHFLVSALNELLAIKAELDILCDKHGVRLSSYELKTENDELILSYKDEVFQYLVDKNTVNPTVQRIQETIFHEKETLIEECLFGVDINDNSAKICRLRLWIELLKHAYYTEVSGYTQLETLPNIDINIQTGQSLINRFDLNEDLRPHLKKLNVTIEEYAGYVNQYKTAPNKEERKRLYDEITKIKKGFRSHIGRNNKLQLKLDRLQEEYNLKYKNKGLFDQKLTPAQLSDKKSMENELAEKAKEIGDIKESVIYNNAFEWRFEFPEVLNSEGDYVGFDVVIGNPPYVFGGNEGISIPEKKYYTKRFKAGKGKINLFTLFIERAFDLLRDSGDFSFIVPNTFLRVTSYHESRQQLIDHYTVNTIKDEGDSVFEDAITTAIILIAEKREPSALHQITILKNHAEASITQADIKKANYVIAISTDPAVKQTMEKFTANTIPLGTICDEMIFGVVITKNRDEVVSSEDKPHWKPFLEGRDIGPYLIKPLHSYLNYDPALLHRPRTADIFEVPEKILIQRITGGSRPLKAAYDNQQFYNKESINNIILGKNSGFEYKYILALLNSSLINWYYTKQFTNDSRLTVNLSKEYLSQIPVAKISIELQQSFVKIVDYIIEVLKIAEAIDPYVSNAHIADGFREIIDAMVYEIYFPSEFEKVQLSFGEYINQFFFTLTGNDDRELITKAYQQLREPNNVLRNNLKLLDIRLGSLIMPIKTA
jgi:adenine-specific DNA-methyltransferase